MKKYLAEVIINSISIQTVLWIEFRFWLLCQCSCASHAWSHCAWSAMCFRYWSSIAIQNDNYSTSRANDSGYWLLAVTDASIFQDRFPVIPLARKMIARHCASLGFQNVIVKNDNYFVFCWFYWSSSHLMSQNRF